MSEVNKKLLLVILTGLAFGSSVVFARFALREINPYTIAFFRFGIASLVFIATFIIYKKKIPKSPNILLHMAIVGITGTGLPIFLYYFALTYISAGIFTIFLSLLPLVTAILAHILIRSEKMSKEVIFGLLLGFVGVLVLIVTKSNGLSGGIYSLKGPLIVLLGVCSSAFGWVWTKTRLDKEDTLVVSTIQTVSAFIFVAILVFASGSFKIGTISTLSWFSVLYNGIVGSFIAFWLTFKLVKKYGAVASALPNYVIPLVTTSLGALFLGEIITLPILLGAGVILVGVYFSNKN